MDLKSAAGMLLGVLLILSATVRVDAAAPTAEKPRPSQSAVPEPPPMPEGYRPPSGQERPEDLEPEITIVPKKDAIYQEYRINGRLYMIKVEPKVGPPYYLIDRQGTGEFSRSEFAPDIAIPSWVIKRF